MNELQRCQLGRMEDNWAHDFSDYEPSLGGSPLLFCRRCGDVRELRLPPQEAALGSDEVRRRGWHAMDSDHVEPFEKCDSAICRGDMPVPV
jgi:hypothetical protein